MPLFTESPAQTEKRALRAVSRKAGCALLAVCALQLAVTPAALLRSRLPAMGEELWFSLIVALSSLTVLGGALLGVRLLGIGGQGRPFRAGQLARRPYSWEDSLLIPAGAALCMAGNLVAAFVERLAGRAGIEFHGGPEQVVPQGAPGLLLMLLVVGLLPAVTEELLLRGVILPALRRFGDGFAVTCAAALFALLHQNMEQAPMAFVSGLALGWVYVRSGRLVSPMLVHLWNNAAAVLLMLLPEHAANVYALVLGLLGLVCLFTLYLRRPAPKNQLCPLSPGRRAVHFFFGSVAMVLPLAYFITVILLNTRFPT